ncbi:MAG: HEAT repeat domain-containing protein [Candidatus Thorarchaeota archaeon]
MMKFKKSLRQTLISEVVGVQDSYGAHFEADAPPKVKIRTKVAGPWIWIHSEADYEGATWDYTTDRLSGDPYSAHVFHDWVGEVKSAPKVVSKIEQLHEWALLHTDYKRQYTDVGSWGRHSGRWVDNITKEGIVSLRVESKRTFHDVSPTAETGPKQVDLSHFSDRSFDGLVELLKNENPFIREIAANLLGALDDLQAVDHLIQATDDESVYVQEIAIRTLGNLSGSKAIQKLATMLIESEYPRPSVSHALAEIGEPALDSLLPALHSENERVSLAAVRIIENIRGKKAIKILNQTINDIRPAVRGQIILALGNLGAIETIENVITSLEDESTDVQKEAVRALGKLKDKRAVEPLVGVLLASDKYVRSDAAEALDLLGWQPSSPKETAWLLFAKQDWKKLVAMGDDAVETILKALDDDDNYLRGEILDPISESGITFTDPRIADAILKIYNDKTQEDYRRRDAIRALGYIPIQKSVRPLLRFYLSDERSEYLGKGAFDAITRLVTSDVDVAKILIPMLRRKKVEKLSKEQLEVFLKIFTVVPISRRQIKNITPLLEVAVKRWVEKDTTVIVVGKKKTSEIASGLLELDKLITELSEGDIPARENAAKAIGEIGLPSATISLVEALEDSYPPVRQKAVTALGKLGEGAFSKVLAALSNNDYRVRMGAAEALGHLRDVRAAEQLLKTLRDMHRIVRQNAAWALGELYLFRSEHKALTSKVIRALTKAMRKDDYLPVRINAVYALGEIDDSRIIKPLLEAMDSPVEYIRLNATNGFLALARILKDPSKNQAQVIDKLILALSDDADRVRYNAADGLRLFGGEKALAALLSIRDDKDTEMRELVERGIKEINTMKGKKHSSWGYTERARYELRDPEVMEELIQMLGDDDEDIQRSAQIALGEFGQLAFDRLMEVLHDKEEYWSIREGAAGALGRVGDKRAVEALIVALKDEKKEIRCNAAWSLAELKDKRSVKALVEATRDDFWMVRLNASAGLGKIKGRRILDVILGLLDDEHPRVREIVTSYLGKFKSPRVIPALKAQLNDDDEGVRKQAKNWLDHLAKKKSKSKKK